MVPILLSTLLVAAPSASSEPECEHWRELVLDVAKWQSDMGDPAKRCEAMASAGFKVGSAWECNHAPDSARTTATHGARYSVSGDDGRAAVLLCTGPSSGKCTDFVALQPLRGKNRWCRANIFFPPTADDERDRFYVMNADRSGALKSTTLVPIFDCKVMTPDGTLATDSCPGDKITFHWKVSSAGLMVREPELQLSPEEMSAQVEQERGEAMDRAAAAAARPPLMFARARSVGRVPPSSVWSTEPGRELTALWWLGDQLCVTQDAQGTVVRCFDPVSERWGKPRPVDASMKHGTLVGPNAVEFQGRDVKLSSINRLETQTKCHGFEQLEVQDRTFPVAKLDADQTLQLGGYPDREIVRLVFSPSGSYGVAVEPNFDRGANPARPPPEGTLPCGDANFPDWAVTSYQLFVFSTAP